LIQKFVAKLSERERKVFYVTLVIGSLAVSDFLFLGPVLDELELIEAEIENQKISIVRDMRFLSYKDKIMKEGKVFNKYFVDNVPDDDVVNADFLSLIEKLATKSNVSLVKSNPSHSNKLKQSNEYYANVDCNGTLSDVISFMHTINSTGELLKVVKFDMTPMRGDEDKAKASMTVVKLIVY